MWDLTGWNERMSSCRLCISRMQDEASAPEPDRYVMCCATNVPRGTTIGVEPARDT